MCLRLQLAVVSLKLLVEDTKATIIRVLGMWTPIGPRAGGLPNTWCRLSGDQPERGRRRQRRASGHVYTIWRCMHTCMLGAGHSAAAAGPCRAGARQCMHACMHACMPACMRACEHEYSVKI